MKRFVPEMAAHYKFHYQFVTYKWPSFLHKQVTIEPMFVSLADVIKATLVEAFLGLAVCKRSGQSKSLLAPQCRPAGGYFSVLGFI